MADKIQEIIKKAQTSYDQQRRKKQSDRFNVFIDNFDDEILNKIKKQFHQDNLERLYYMIASYYNLFKKVVNSKSLLYKKEASRKWMKRDGITEDDKYSEYLAGTNLHSASQTINKYANANNVSFMRLKPNYEKQIIDYEPVPAENIVILRDENDPLVVTAIMHKIVNDYTYWLYSDNEKTCKISKEFDKIYDEQKVVFKDPNKSNTGIIPYVPVWAMAPMANDFWNYTVNDDLYNATLQVNVHLTHFNNILKTGCYKQIVFTGIITEDIKSLYNHVTDGMNPIALKGEQTKVDVLTMSDKYSEFMDAIDSIASRVLDQHGFDFETQSKSATKSSGISIKLRQDALDDLKEEQQPLFREYEKQLAYYTIVMANQVFKTGIDINGTFQINFWEEEHGLTPDDVAVLDWQMINGIKSVVDVFKKFNPDVPDDMIEQTILDNKAQYKKTLGVADERDTEIDDAFQQTQEETVNA